MNRVLLSFLTVLVASSAAAEPVPRVRVGLQAAGAVEQGNLFAAGPSDHTSLIMFQPQLAVALVQSGERPVLELVSEVTLAETIRPSGRFIISVNEGFRFQMRPTRKVGTYLELGAGVAMSGLHTNPNASPNREERRPEEFDKLDGWGQFHLQIGGGLRINVGRGALQMGYRLTHFSNNGTLLPNLGLNLNTVAVSYQTRPF